MPSSLAKIYVGQRPRTGDSNGTGTGGWGSGIGGWGFDTAFLPGAEHLRIQGALSSALAGTLLGSALSGYFESTKAKRPATSDLPQGQPFGRYAGGRAATSSDQPRGIDVEQHGADSVRLGGRLCCMVPAEPLVLPGDNQARCALPGRSFLPQTAHTTLLVASQSPQGMPLPRVRPRTREMTRNAILKEDVDAELLGVELWSSDNDVHDVLQMKQRSQMLRKRTVELLQRAEEAELQYSEQFVLPQLEISASSRIPTAARLPPGAELGVAAGCATGVGSDSEACDAEDAKTQNTSNMGTAQAREQAQNPEREPPAAEARLSSKGRTRVAQANKTSLPPTPRVRRNSARADLDGTSIAIAIAKPDSTAIAVTADGGATLDGAAKLGSRSPKDPSQNSSPLESPDSSRRTSGSTDEKQMASPSHGRVSSLRDGRNKPHGLHSGPSLGSATLESKDGQGVAKHSDNRLSVKPERDTEVKDAKEVRENHKKSHSLLVKSPPKCRKAGSTSRSFNSFMQHSPVTAISGTARSDERKVYEVSKKMDIYEGHSSLSLISMFLCRTTGDLRIHVLLMSHSTHVETVVEAKHVEDLFGHVQYFGRPEDSRDKHGHRHQHGHGAIGHRQAVTPRGSNTSMTPRASGMPRLSRNFEAVDENDDDETPMGATRTWPERGSKKSLPMTSNPNSQMRNWERLSELIQVDRDDVSKSLAVYIMGWHSPEDRKAVEQLQVKMGFADIFHKTQQDMQRSRFQ